MATVNWIGVKNTIEGKLGKPLTKVLDGTMGDIKNFIMGISNDLLVAAKKRDQDMIDTIPDQLVAAAKKNKVAATKKELESILKIIKEEAFKGIIK